MMATPSPRPLVNKRRSKTPGQDGDDLFSILKLSMMQEQQRREYEGHRREVEDRRRADEREEERKRREEDRREERLRREHDAKRQDRFMECILMMMAQAIPRANREAEQNEK